jgi:Cdc6-like AAA superfamily ATPase
MKPDDVAKLTKMMQSPSVPAEARADALIYNVAAAGLDMRAVVAQLIQEADAGRKAAADKDNGPLSPELYIGHWQFAGQTFAYVTNGLGEIYLPCTGDDIKDMERGDSVLVDGKQGKLVGRNGAFVHPGDLVSVESIPERVPDHVVVKHQDRSVLARLSQKLIDAETPLTPGTRVVYDPVRHFVSDVIDTETKGDDLLTSPEVLAQVSRADLGAPHPVLDDMLFRMKMFVRHPEWMASMRVRPRMSYLFVGPTGTGKTFLLKILARELTDYIEELTGQRISRLVMCDASSFYSPWFGQTEENINKWFSKLATLGGVSLRAKDGREVRVPLLVVLEEAEALLRGRGEMGGSSHLFDRPLAQILQKLDSLTDELNIPLIFVSTTNRPDLVDPAARRRLGISQVTFGMLSAGQAASVLAKKIPADLPVRRRTERQAVIAQVQSYLYGNDPAQDLVEVRLVNGERRTLHRRDLVTPATLEMAVSSAIDECIRQSAEANDLLGLDAEGIIRALQGHYATLATTLRPHNLREHYPDWFTEDSLRVEDVRPLVRRTRRPMSVAVA